MASESLLISTSLGAYGVKVPVQMVLLSMAWLELIELSDPLALTLPLSLMTVMSAALVNTFEPHTP